MKKFIVSENIAHATSRSFKGSIDFAVSNTERGHNFSNSNHGKKFVGTVVTFNQTSKEVECFSHYDYIDYSNEEQVAESVLKKLASIIEDNEEFKTNEFITFVRASGFDYHGFVGYESKEQQEIRTMKLEHLAMSIYIGIINSNDLPIDSDSEVVGTSIDTLELSIRTHNCLLRAGVGTVEKVLALSLEEVTRIRNLGRNSLEELERVLNIEFK